MATIKKVPISIFIQELEAALARHDGYIMGAKGQNPKTGSLDLSITKESSAWQPNGYYYTQYNTGYSAAQKQKALYWREHATRVWDCNGLAEGIYELHTGININSRARNNYADWCEPKGASLSTLPKEPGIAVFKYNSSAGYITHIGYLWKPIDINKPNGDWWVIEAKGVLYGVVKTCLSAGSWNRWGKMTKYYDYENNTITEQVIWMKGDKGSEVKKIQQALLQMGEILPKYGTDGDFGSETLAAVKNFQKKNNLPVTGQVDSTTYAVLFAVNANNTKEIRIINGNCNIRTGPDLSYPNIGVAYRGDKFQYGGQTAENGWNSIIYKNETCWVSGKYSQLAT